MGVIAKVPRATGQRTPPRRWPTQYHDYVFRDGKLIGDFDNMYRYAKSTPWDQDTRCQRWYTQVGMLMVKEHAPYGSILEIGCGLGYIVTQLRRFVTPGTGIVEAFDVSPEAVRKARRLHRGIKFYVDDITQPAFRPTRQYALVIVRDLVWYVFPHLKTVLTNINACVKPRGWLYVCQSFPMLERDFVGKNVIATPEALLAHFGQYEPVYTARLQNHARTADGPMLHFFGRKR